MNQGTLLSRLLLSTTTWLGLVASVAMLQTYCLDAQAQNGSVRVCGLIGALFNSAAVEETREEWKRLDPQVAQCVARNFGVQVSDFATQCISPNDTRVLGPLRSCTQAIAQERAQQQQQIAAREAAERAQQAQAESAERDRQARAAAEERAQQAKAAADAAEKARREARIKDLTARYGSDANAILAGEVHTGMTSDEVLEARGNPIAKIVVPPDDELWRFSDERVVFSAGKVTYVDK